MTEFAATIPGRLEDLQERVGKLEEAVAENTEITRDVRDMLVAGRVLVKAAKVAGIVAGAGSAMWAAGYQILHNGNLPGK
jgi:hypothetical protein